MLVYFLLKIVHADITPGIAAKIKQDGVDSFDIIEMGGKVIIVFYLGGELLSLQPEFGLKKSIGKLYPIYCREGYSMCIKITGCTSKFGSKRDVAELLYLVLNSFHKNH